VQFFQCFFWGLLIVLAILWAIIGWIMTGEDNYD
jgi:hypothetical protein